MVRVESNGSSTRKIVHKNFGNLLTRLCCEFKRHAIAVSDSAYQ